jgi:hypothetical protein
MTIIISNTYDLVWHLKDTDYYFTKDGRCFNVKRGIEVKRILVGSTPGFSINGKFESLNKIRPKLIKVTKIECPF